jgi:prepilin-type processing-associated H-X9-DG protein
MPGWGWALLAGCGAMFLFMSLILAAILFPVFAKAREKARQSSCASNLHQISLQMLGYAQDNDDRFPPADHWIETLKPYSPQTEEADRAYHCTAVPGPGGPDIYGYAYNRNVAGKPAAKIADPRAKMLVYDSSVLTRNASDPGTSRPEAGRHSKGNNVAFADGHVYWVRVGTERAGPENPAPKVTP